ncbi:MAG: hypothetical protein WDW36_006365 [Sanguina aurantia]
MQLIMSARFQPEACSYGNIFESQEELLSPSLVLFSPPQWGQLLGMDWAAQPDLHSASPAGLSDLSLQDASHSHITHEHRWAGSQSPDHSQNQQHFQQQQQQQVFIRQNSQQAQQHSHMIQVCSPSPPPPVQVAQPSSLAVRQLKVPHAGAALSAGPVLSTMLRNAAFARSSASSMTANTGLLASDASMFRLPRSSSGTTSQLTDLGSQHSYSHQRHEPRVCHDGQQPHHDLQQSFPSQDSSTVQHHHESRQQSDCHDLWLQLLPTFNVAAATDAQPRGVDISRGNSTTPHHFPTPPHKPHRSPPNLSNHHPAQQTQATTKPPTPCSSPARFMQAQHASAGPASNLVVAPQSSTAHLPCGVEAAFTASLPRLRLGRVGSSDPNRSQSVWDGSLQPVGKAAAAAAAAAWGSALHTPALTSPPTEPPTKAQLLQGAPPLATLAPGHPSLAPRTPTTPSSKGANQATPAHSPPARPSPRSARTQAHAAPHEPLLLSRASFPHASLRRTGCPARLDSGLSLGSRQFPWPSAPPAAAAAAAPPRRSRPPAKRAAIARSLTDSDSHFQAAGEPRSAGGSSPVADASDSAGEAQQLAAAMYEELVHIAYAAPVAANLLAAAGRRVSGGATACMDHGSDRDAPHLQRSHLRHSGGSGGSCNEQQQQPLQHHASNQFDECSIWARQQQQQQEWWSVSGRRQQQAGAHDRVQSCDSDAANAAFAGELEHWAGPNAAAERASPFLLPQYAHAAVGAPHPGADNSPFDNHPPRSSLPLPRMPPDDPATAMAAQHSGAYDDVLTSLLGRAHAQILPVLARATCIPAAAAAAAAAAGGGMPPARPDFGSSSALDASAGAAAARPPSERCSKRKLASVGSLHGHAAGVVAAVGKPEYISKAAAAGPVQKRVGKKSKLADGSSSSAAAAAAAAASAGGGATRGLPVLADIVKAGLVPAGAQQFLVGNVILVDAVLGLDGTFVHAGQGHDSLSSFALAALKPRNPARMSCDGWKEVRWQGASMEDLRQRCIPFMPIP